MALHARVGAPEYWIIAPDVNTLHQFLLVDGRYQDVAANTDGRMRSRALPELAFDSTIIFEGIEGVMAAQEYRCGA